MADGEIEVAIRGNVVAKLDLFGARTLEGILAGVNKACVFLQSYIVSQKLSGQVLRRITGRLSDSVGVEMATANGDDFTGAVVSGAPTAPYGAVHEFGGENFYTIYPVNAKALAFRAGAYTVMKAIGARSAEMALGDMVFARKVIHPPLKPRPFMAPSVEETSEEMTGIIGETAYATANEGQE